MSIDTIILQYIFYFIIYSISGLMLESVYRSFCEKKLINSGFMTGPYCPIYGFGAIFMQLLLKNFKSDITLLFVISFVVLTFWEYVVGVCMEKIFHTKYWDYSDQRINIQGRVCLKNSIFWGVLGVVFILAIEPMVEKLTAGIGTRNLLYIDITVGIIMIVDLIVSSIKVSSISKKMQELKSLGDKIIEKVKEETQSKVKITELELKYNKLQMALYKQLTRLKNAFPTMQWDTANKFLNQKLDIKEIKEKIKDLKSKVKINLSRRKK